MVKLPETLYKSRWKDNETSDDDVDGNDDGGVAAVGLRSHRTASRAALFRCLHLVLD